MNKTAEKHLTKAKRLVAEGDKFYRQAKVEMDAAHAAGATEREMVRILGKSKTWIHDVLAWDGKGTLYGKDTERRQLDQAKQVLKDPVMREKVLQKLTPGELTDLTEDAIQTHPATSKKAPVGLPPSPKFGFTLEMGRPSARLQTAIDLYVEAWEEHSPTANEEELQIERDLIAPKVFSLRATVEEMQLT